jgi:mRNA interferase RelE/StbE
MLPRVLKAPDRLEQWPNVSGVTPLRGDLAGHYRLRVGDWRIVFRVQGEDVIVVGVAHRKDIYED